MRVFVNNQYDKIERCILVYPSNLQKTDNQITNEINLKRASKQYNTLINIVIENGVKAHFLDINGRPSQLFATDIGFVINDLLFVTKMKEQVRQAEIDELKEFVQNNKIKHYVMQSTVEGGDILVHNHKVFIGQGERTSEDAFLEIGNILKANNMNYELIKVFFEVSKIHLDCTFNILDKNTCIMSKDVFNREEVVKHFSKVIEIEPEELKFLAPNIVNLGHNHILCSSGSFADVLRSNGYVTTFIEFDEINKDKGSLACCVFPILRTSN